MAVWQLQTRSGIYPNLNQFWNALVQVTCEVRGSNCLNPLANTIQSNSSLLRRRLHSNRSSLSERVAYGLANQIPGMARATPGHSQDTPNNMMALSGRRQNQFILLRNIARAGTERKKRKEKQRCCFVVPLLTVCSGTLCSRCLCDTSFILSYQPQLLFNNTSFTTV